MREMQMQEFGWNRESLWGLAVYLAIGGLTFVVDFSIIYFSIHKLRLSYAQAVAAGFIVGAFFNYAMNRAFVYANSAQSHLRSMGLFFAIAFIWLWFTIGGTVLLVKDFHLNLYVARSLIGMFVAIVGYVLNALYTFKIPTRP